MAAESGKKYVKTYKDLLTNKTVASLDRVAWGDFPGFTGSMKSSDISSPSQIPPVSLGIRYLRWMMGFAPPETSPDPRVAVVHGRRWTGPISFAGDGRFSQVSGEPMCMHAPLFDPSGTACPCHNGRGRYCLPGTKHRRPHALSSFEAPSRSLHARCLRFTAWVAPARRKTRFPLGG